MNKLPERIRIKDIARLANVSVGTVDRVIHGRSGVSEVSKKRVEKILKELDYHPNMYASALASNKKYMYACLLPQHLPGEYWTAVEEGIHKAVDNYSDFNISANIFYYDPYDYHSFVDKGQEILAQHPDGVLFAPTAPQYTKSFTDGLNEQHIPYIYIDSIIRDIPSLSFLGQNSGQSGVFAAKMLMMLAAGEKQVVIFRRINAGIVGSNQQENREKGFRLYMKEHHPDCDILELNLQAKHEEEDNPILEKFFRDYPHVANGITFNSKVYNIGEYLQKEYPKKFNLIGYDLLERNVACLKQGSVALLIAQQPEVQGFTGIKLLCDHLIFKKEVAPINYMPIDLLSAENIDYYSKLNYSI
ncbi:LacI family DNA-binding transcriptional regulator [Bacteroides sp. 214]|uniref:LacI family DNA-binding transcriptional regulator n=1 Tax=Bacteroides sp. 214 TaxID=2302935 RepID=UPI0013D79183|nr:LacI family DNA-binding transcriptional regulator [Bacteroides sp. 214]NDW12727.1 LacI family DNA-binding transcriptional regulator [Bacteroides sp. 214]